MSNTSIKSSYTGLLFRADPIIRPFNLAPVLQDLERLCKQILARVGDVQQFILYPHRVFKQRAWHIKVIGEKGITYLLLNIGGYYQFVSEMNATRLSLSVADDIDAFWFAYALSERLAVPPTIPTGLFGGYTQ
ncbi:hypothetical protein L5B97_12215 [Avibacterium sp. 20-15]|uniref:hypothetical protein n=1 Tax=unclassified Avibacterium TaxID=2685287 RepID=UPI002025FDAD|nr:MULTISPECIES: hypothetical protein [unclassified Avibacterium]MCW9734218.1 hypothetical protein [Avibacterium sp. 20-15]URL03641.1 hypothetical protein L4F93_08710 [Avibacterium sp. 20-132]URL03853.1 hypothetical protein L4F93_09865 [Avibacterium sp. 20-132]